MILTKNELLKNLNEEQKEAVCYFKGPLLVLAGAGSGKTRVITYKIAYATKYLGYNPERILAITFTNKAANELKERIKNLLGKEAPIWASTFHSFCLKILRRHIDKLGYSRYFEIYDESDSKKLIEKVISELNLDKDKYPSSLLKNLFSKIKNESLAYEELEDNIKEAFNLYNKLLKEKNALDFDDLLLKTIELFEKEKGILNFYKNYFEYVLVDEYQDTNPTQYKLIKYLCLEKGNICAVGDDYQAIYSFRGADINIILNFEKDFKDAKVIKLTKNYRSTKTILEAANYVILNNKKNYQKKLEAIKEEGEKIRLFKAPNSEIEVKFLVKAIKKLSQDKKIPLNDIAILYRSNFLSREIEEALIKENIPYTIVGGLRFYERKEIKDILAYLKFPFFPKNEDTIERVFKYPSKGLGKAAILKFLHTYEQKEKFLKDTKDAFLETLKELSTKKGFKILYSIYKRYLEEFENKSFKDLINFVLEESKYLEYLQKEYPNNYEDRYENILELINALEEFSKKHNFNTKKETFLEFLANISLENDKEKENNGISLMTVHAAKGLEFKVVFLVALEDGIFPSKKSLEEGNLEEERRLFYVGITRAKDLLFLSYSQNRMYFGKLQRQVPSRFLSEIPKNLIFEVKLQNKAKESENNKKHQNVCNIKNSLSNFKKGDLVLHKKFGVGKILNVFGDNLKIYFVKLKEVKEIKKDFVKKI